MKQPKARSVYTPEFKAQVVEDYKTGKWTQQEVGARHGIHPTLVSQWLAGRGGPRRGPRRPVELTVAAASRAVDKLNGRLPVTPTLNGAGDDSRLVVGQLIRGVVDRLRSIGIDVQQITVTPEGDYDIRYSVKEIGKL